MSESDLRLHLSQQIDKSIALFDVIKLDLPADEATNALGQLLADSEVVLFDTLYPEHLAIIGRLMCDASIDDRTLFCVGSSGVQYALTAHWQTLGMLPTPLQFQAREVEQVVAVSGSCSPVTAAQIEWAVAHGWGEVALRTEVLVDAAKCDAEIARAVNEALKVLSCGHSVVMHACCGPYDERLSATTQCGSFGPCVGPHFGHRSGKEALAARGCDRWGYLRVCREGAGS